LLVAFVGVTSVFYVFFWSMRVEGDSMAPNYRPGDRLLMTRSYPTPHRGDVVVFSAADYASSKDRLIKRVIAGPGDTIEVRGDVAIVNGVQEPSYGVVRSKTDDTYDPPHKLGANEIYVMGDNRPVALDSRQIGAVPLSKVMGRAVFRWAPIQRLGRAR
jgi:signal peptidase I